ncbi:MAG: ParB/RepB/Spo0J family partition protein [Bacteroidales bacterium]|nr:ParB/RepB/Spo0J family partition protein [Bacteroidales bacterium]
MAKRNALGRGLDALITMDDAVTRGSSSINEIELSKIISNPDQPRRIFDEEAMEELAASISKIGVIQPITLRKIDGEKYQIIAGERRYRASQMAGLDSIPAYIKTADDDELMEMALIENIQREDLNAIEIALAYQNLIDSFSLTQEQLSERVGKKRATVANYLRLLKLPAEVQMGIKDRKIDMGHARALVTINDPVSQLAVYNLILRDGLSVRKVESIVKEINKGKDVDEVINPSKSREPRASKEKKSATGEFSALKKHLSDYFKTEVQFTCNKQGKGKITIPFKSPEELERIIGIFDQLTKK